MTSAPGETITTLWLPPLVLISAVLYALGLIVLLSPVTTGIPSGDQVTDGIGSYSRTCGVTLVQAFATPPPGVEGLSRDSALDCASTARGRVGYGLLLLLVAVPVGALALLTEGRSSSRSRSRWPVGLRDDRGGRAADGSDPEVAYLGRVRTSAP